MAYFIYPLLFALLPLLFLYSQNAGELRFRHIAPLALMIALSVVALMLVLRYLCGFDYSSVAPIACGIIIIFYTTTNKLKRFFSRYYYQYILQYAFYLLLLITAAKYHSFFTIFFNVIVIAITALLSINIFIKLSENKKNKGNQALPGNEACMTSIKNEDKPDVYDILFDAYIGIDSLKKTIGFDNSLFYEELRKRGFHIPEKTYSNYNHTAASVPSLMNMNYTEGYLTEEDFQSKAFSYNNSRYRFFKMVGGLVPQIFKNMGYKYVITGEPLLDDDLLSKFSSFIDAYTDRAQNLIKNGAAFAFFARTIIGSLFRKKKDMLHHVDYIHRILGAIPDITKHESPVFAFTHVWAPHTPYVFNADGSINEKFSTLNDLTSEDDETKAAYAGNLRHMNTLILKCLDKLSDEIQKKGRKAIVILHSDHGLFKSEERSSEYNIIFAHYEYKIDNKNIFPKDIITLTNTYRYLFNGVFGANYPILKNEFLYENWFAGDYNTENITDKVTEEIYGKK